MRPEIDAALDECLEDLRRGLELERCLDRYPEYAAELRPLLQTVMRMGRVLTPPAMEEARAAGRERMLAALARREGRAGFWRRPGSALAFPRPTGLAPAWRLAALALVLLLVGGVLAGAASAASVATPGQALYPLKEAARQVRLSLTLDPASRELLEGEVAEARRRDVAAALQAGRRARVAFQGTLEAAEGRQWSIGGLPVTLDPETVIQGPAQVGALVRVQGRLPGDGRLLAGRIEVEMPAGPPTPTPTATMTVTGAPTREATPTLAPSQTPTPTPTVTPMPAVTATPTSSPTATPTSTTTPTAGVTPTAPPQAPAEPEQTVEPGGSPQPPATRVFPTGRPTGEPEETEEPEDEDDAEETRAPETEHNPTRAPGDTAAPGRRPHPSATAPQPTKIMIWQATPGVWSRPSRAPGEN